MKTISILGSSGSTGTQTVDVISNYDIKTRAISVGKNIEIAKNQIERLKPEICAVADEKVAKELSNYCFGKGTKIISGDNAATEVAKIDVDICVNAVSGFAGLSPTLQAVKHCKRLAIANKETLVAAGDFVKSSAKENGCEIIPVDSEHSAIFQCLQDKVNNKIKRLIITCSGGAFFGKTREELEHVKLSDALKHPTWNMGGKITVDCASLVNKGLEVIEAMHLFNVPADKIDVVIHRESIIHSMVEFEDNAVIAQLGSHDMRLPIQYALTYPNRDVSLSEQLDFVKLQKLTFSKPDTENFPSLLLAFEAAKKGGLVPCVFNASNEAAVKLFMEGKVSFNSMYEIIKATMGIMGTKVATNINEVYECHRKSIEIANIEAEKYYLK